MQTPQRATQSTEKPPHTFANVSASLVKSVIPLIKKEKKEKE